MEIRAAKADERDEIVDLISAVFVEKCRPRYASQHYQDSTYALDQSRVCVVDGKIVSYVRVSDRSMYIGEAVLKLGGIGMVVTSPEYRGRGYASALLRDAIAYMEAQNYDLSLLFTTIQPFYTPLGWAPFPQTTFELELYDKKNFAPSGWKSRPFDLEKDLTQVSQIYDEHNSGRTGTVLRSEPLWRDGYSQQVGMLPSLVIEKDGQIGGYANLAFPDEDQGIDAYLATYYPNLREVGCRSETPDSPLALCHAILEAAYERDVDSISGRLTRHHPMTLLLSEESGSPLSFSIHERMMYRLISLERLFQKLIPKFEAQLENSAMIDRSGSFHFTVSDQTCTLNLNRGKVTVTADDTGSTKIALSAYHFFKVLFGDGTFGQLNELNRTKGINLQPDEMALLSTLFPKDEPTHWICDYF